MLLQQVSLPVAAFSPESLVIEMKGGTNATKAPQVDYAKHVFLPVLQGFGLDASLTINKRGFFPRGGGIATLQVNPVETLRPIRLVKRGQVQRITIVAYSAGRHEGLEIRMAELVRDTVTTGWGIEGLVIEEDLTRETPATALGDGFGVVVVAHTAGGCVLAGSALGEVKTATAESVVAEACHQLEAQLGIGACVDEYLADQLIIYMALAQGTSVVSMGPLSLHTETAIHFAEVMSGAKFKVEETQEGNLWLVSCEGIGFRPG